MPARTRLLLLLAAFAAFHGLAWGSWEGLWSSIDFNGAPLEDFMGPYWNTASRVLETGRPAPGYYYPPTLALLLTPLVPLGPGPASWVWLGVQLAGLVALLLIPLAVLRVAPGRSVGYLAVGLFSFPLLHNLHWGQVGSLLTLALVVACLLEGRGLPRAGAACVGCAGALKLTPIALLAAYVRRERWGRGAVAGGVLALLLVGLPYAVLGSRAGGFYSEVARAVQAARTSSELWAGADAAQALPALAGRVLGLAPGVATLALELAGALAFLALAWRLAADRARPARPWIDDLVPLVVALPACFGPGWAHWFTHVPFACLWLLARDPTPLGARAVWVVGTLSSVPVFRAVTAMLGDTQAYGRLGLLAIANAFLLGAVLRVRFSSDRAQG